jgi:BolA family transcriptional regulator, general stress-responsive regulator
MHEARVTEIRKRLVESLRPELLEVEDESHLHAGHAGARDGRGHFRVTVVSSAFAGKSRIARHRLVYEVMGDLMSTDIHALAVQALAPDEI